MNLFTVVLFFVCGMYEKDGTCSVVVVGNLLSEDNDIAAGAIRNASDTELIASSVVRQLLSTTPDMGRSSKFVNFP